MVRLQIAAGERYRGWFQGWIREPEARTILQLASGYSAGYHVATILHEASMLSDARTRRSFLRVTGAAGAAFLLCDVVEVKEALAWAAARRTETGPHVLRNLTPRQAATLDAITKRIIPSDDGLPGAAEAGAIHYIDRALEGFAAPSKPLIEQGVADIDAAAARRWPGTTSFAGLTGERQDELLTEIEQAPFFQTVRLHTVIGTFAQPSYGGNRDHIGWTLVGQGHEPLYQPPFGWYDAQPGGDQ